MDRHFVSGKDYRFTVLSDRMIRMEYQAEGMFEDCATQMAVKRDLPAPAFSSRKEEGWLEIETKALLLRYDHKPFSSEGLSVYVKETGNTWHYSVPFGNPDRNLLGTARTLDATDGFVQMDPGIFGEKGYAVLDDSLSPVLDGEEYRRRDVKELDLYFFGFGKDFFGGLKEYHALSGEVPMIPRYALGNWWSRYYRYTQESYLTLLDQFAQEDIPLSVAVIDMDWHLTEPDPRYGTGWTGFSWNRELFPNYRAFLAELKKRDLSVTLNLHPADGIRAYEDMYARAAARMGIDPATEQPVPFDFADPRFREVYFEEIIHPYEKDGVDFWWIDWQQGTGSQESEDPLLLLNHFHYKDQEEQGKRAMIFSRYAGPGSHRYPIGFSGDSIASWKSLHFQPYFTAAASNIGYGWWSHDIGGHMMGDRNDERFIRWIQFGVFSPIMRIHSSNSPFLNKEPWAMEEPYRKIMGDYMRLRHRMIPYLYTAACAASRDSRPLIQPLYYRYPWNREAYETPDGYFFGPSLLVMPITQEADHALRMGSVTGWIPEGRWTDLFTGQVYRKQGKHRFYRPLEQIPVMIPAGGTVVFSAEPSANGIQNPKSLEIIFGAGADCSYELYEDDGETTACIQGKYALTGIEMEWLGSNENASASGLIRILPVKGDCEQVPARRSFVFSLAGAAVTADTVCRVMSMSTGKADPDTESSEKSARDEMTIPVSQKGLFPETGPIEVDACDGIVIRIDGITLSENNKEQMIFDILNRAWIENAAKDSVFKEWNTAGSGDEFLERLAGLDVSENLKDAIREVFL